MRHPIDPFSLKSLPKWHIKRVSWTACARLQEKIAALSFASMAVPIKQVGISTEHPEPEKDQTAVTGQQLSYLIEAVKATEYLSETVVVEIGSY